MTLSPWRWLEYCEPHALEVEGNRSAIFAGIRLEAEAARKDETGEDVLEGMYNPALHYNLEAPEKVSEAYEKLMRYLALSKRRQLTLGRNLRLQRTKKGAAAGKLPTCARCGKVRALDPCRDCATEDEAKLYPAMPSAA